MGRLITIRKPRPNEIRKLHKLIEKELQGWQRRRAEAILLHAAGLNCSEIAKLLEANPKTIYVDLWAFEKDGLAAVEKVRSVGMPRRITDVQLAEIIRIAKIAPYELGLPYGRWSLRKLRDYLIKKRVIKSLGHERLRQLLKKGGCTFAGLDANSLAKILNATRSSIE